MLTPAALSPISVGPAASTGVGPRAVSARAPIAAALCAVAAAGLGYSLQVNWGQYAAGALLPLGGALLASLLAVATGGAEVSARAVRVVLFACVAGTFAMLLTSRPCATWPAEAGRALFAFRLIVAVGAVAAAAALTGRGATRRAAGWLLVVSYVAAGLIALKTVPQPGVDVCVFQREAAAALLAGRNPYSITYADPYGGRGGFYGTDLVREGRTTFGYPYPPLPLLIAVPGHLLGDFRLSMLAATALAGILLLYARPPSTLGVAAVAMLLFTPRGFFVLEAGWIEPVVILGLAFTIFVACRYGPVISREQAARRRVAPAAGREPVRPGVTGQGFAWVLPAVAVGLFLATKQYLALAVPLLFVLPVGGNGRKRLWFLGLTAAVVAVMTVPAALPDLDGFWRSVVTLQFHQPFRSDGLSFLVPLAGGTGHAPAAAIPFIAAAGVIALCLWRAPRTPAGFATALAAVSFAFFAFNKQAFCNYYHFVIAAAGSALAAQERGDRSDV